MYICTDSYMMLFAFLYIFRTREVSRLVLIPTTAEAPSSALLDEEVDDALDRAGGSIASLIRVDPTAPEVVEAVRTKGQAILEELEGGSGDKNRIASNYGMLLAFTELVSIVYYLDTGF